MAIIIIYNCSLRCVVEIGIICTNAHCRNVINLGVWTFLFKCSWYWLKCCRSSWTPGSSGVQPSHLAPYGQRSGTPSSSSRRGTAPGSRSHAGFWENKNCWELLETWPSNGITTGNQLWGLAHRQEVSERGELVSSPSDRTRVHRFSMVCSRRVFASNTAGNWLIHCLATEQDGEACLLPTNRAAEPVLSSLT